MGGAALGVIHRDTLFPPKTNFIEKNYAVADYLYQQARTFIGRRDLVIAEPLTDTQQEGMSSTIGKMIPEQIGIRMSQLGVRMDLSKVATTEDINYLKPSISKGEKVDFVLSGTFTRNRSDVNVSMRMIDKREQRVIASFDYILPMNRETRDLAQPQPKIIRLTDK